MNNINLSTYTFNNSSPNFGMNYSIVGFPSYHTPSLAEIMSQYNEQFMLRLLIISFAFFVYTSYNVFFRKPRPVQRPLKEQAERYKKNPWLLLYDPEDGFARTFDELMFLPAIFLMMFVSAYYTGVWI